MEFDALALRIHVGGVGEQAVEGKGLVGVALHQGLEDEVAEDGVHHAARRGAQAFQDERVEIVETADDAIGDVAALGRVRIDVVEMRIVGRKRRLALHGDRVLGFRYGRLEGKDEKRYRGDQPNKNAAHDRLLTGRLDDSGRTLA